MTFRTRFHDDSHIICKKHWKLKHQTCCICENAQDCSEEIGLKFTFNSEEIGSKFEK